MLANTKSLVEGVGKSIGLSKDDVDFLLRIDQSHIFQIQLDDGQTFPAYRMQHKNLLGPYKGGIRYHPGVDADEVSALSILMSLKTAAVGLPLGGGKGGVAVDPRTMSPKQLEELSRAYVRHLHLHLGPDKDVPAPDVSTNSQIIDWMVDEFEQITGDTSKASFTGKSVAKGGSQGREEATGRGGVLTLKAVLEARKDKRPLTYAIQGFGNVGLFFCTEALDVLPQLKLVAATDSRGGIRLRSGLDVQELATHKRSSKPLSDYTAEGVEIITNEQLLSADVDVVVLAALDGAVNRKNAAAVRARYVLELANGPVTHEAEAILSEAGRVIVPDILANAGGVIVSYLEWVQNKKSERWDLKRVHQGLAKYLIPAVKATMETAERQQLSLRQAALANAMKRLLAAR